MTEKVLMMVVVMTEKKRFKVDYDITVGNYCLHDECKSKGVDGYIAYLSDEERANNLCELLNEQHERLCRFGEEIKMLNFKLHQPIIKGVEGFFKYKPNGNKKDGLMYRSIVSNIYYNDELMTYGEVVDLLNKQNNRIKELETEVLDLRVEVGRLNGKKEIETPHWLKYKSSKGYTGQANQDIRFNGDDV